MKAFVSTVLWVHVALLQIPPSGCDNISIDGGRMLVFWSYDAMTDILTLKINASTIGWIGFGFALFAPNGMQDYDIILAGYKDSAGYIYDMYSRGPSPPPVDSSQDYKLISACEEDGHTILHVERPGKTGDANDIQLSGTNNIFLVWALHSSLDAMNDSFYPFHDRRGSREARNFLQLGQSKKVSDEAVAVQASSAGLTSTLNHDTPPREAPMKPEKASVEHAQLKVLSSSEENKKAEAKTTLFLSPTPSTLINPSDSSPESNPSSTGRTAPSQNAKEDKQNLTGKYQMNWTISEKTQYLTLICCILLILGCILKVLIWRLRAKEHKIRQDIRTLPEDDPAECARRIGRLNQEILVFANLSKKTKDKLYNELKKVAYLGLHKDLLEMLDEKRMKSASLLLVLENVTDVSSLAKVLHEELKKPEDKQSRQWKDLSRHLGAGLEVLGGIVCRGIDVKKKWVKALCKEVRSMEELRDLTAFDLERFCQGSIKRVKDSAYKVVEFLANELPGLKDVSLEQQMNEAKAKVKEKLKKAKGLMLKVDEMLSNEQPDLPSVTQIQDRISEILDLSLDGLGKLKPDERQNVLRVAEKDFTNFVQSASTFKSNLEIITTASGGRALCGIYKSKFELPKPAELRLLRKPRTVTLDNPNVATKMGFKTFSEKVFASVCVENVTESSTLAGLRMPGVQSLLAGVIEGELNQENRHQELREVRSTSASAFHYSLVAQKTFQLQNNQLRLTLPAQREALSIVQQSSHTRTSTQSSENNARRFLNRYGSHYPEGVQTLGGLFFSIATAESERKMETTELMTATARSLEGRVSIFFPGSLGTAARVQYSGHKEANEKFREECNRDEVSFSERSVGPLAHNPAAFYKLVSFPSTWALIDRGSPNSYRPVWELIESLGSAFEEPARVLEETWKKDELKRKQRLDEQRMKERMKEETEKLRLVKEDHLKSKHSDKAENFRPLTDKLTPCKTPKTTGRKSVYDKAMEFIMKEPRLHFCEIVWEPKTFGPGTYTLKCWKAVVDTPLSFCQDQKGPVILLSETFFKWKNEIPGRG